MEMVHFHLIPFWNQKCILLALWGSKMESTFACNEMQDLDAEISAEMASSSRRKRELELVYEVTRAINSSLNLDEVIEFIYQGISRILPTDNFYIAFYNEESEEVRFAVELEHRERKAPRCRPAKAGLTEYVLKSKRPLLIPNRFEARCAQLGIRYAGRPSLCWMGAPMVFREQSVGVIAIQSYEDENIFDSEHLEVLENLAGQAASAIENARLFQKLKNSYLDLQATQQRLLQSEKLAAVGQLISGIAHELNNPLTGVVGWTQYLLSQNLAPEMRGHLTTVNDQAQRAARIVQNLLIFSRQHKPERSGVSINSVVENTLALRNYELVVNNIEVHRRLSSDLPSIYADPHQLQQVLLNLIINAEQAMLGARKSGNLYLKTEASTDGVLISVSDDGPGMTPDLLKKVFDPFFTTKPIGQGTGLGLSISYGIVEEHGGRIWATSEPGRGATFYISLPLQTSGMTERPISLSAARVPDEKIRKVLIVDDEESVRDLLTVILENQQFKIETADTGEEGFAKASTSSYDLVVTDLKMPGLGGSELYDKLHERLAKDTPQFLFMTGDVLGNETQQLLDRTNATCILKPFDINEARAAIHQAVARV